MKKILSLVMCIAMMISACCISFQVSAAGNLEIAVGSVSAKAGEQKTVDVTVTANPGFMSATFSAKVTDGSGNAVPGITVTAANGNVFATSEVELGNNIVFLSSADTTKTGTLVTLTINVASTVAAGTYNVEFIRRGVVTNYDEGDVTTTVTNGTLTVSVDVASVTLNKNTLSLASGSSETLTATVAPSNAAQGVTWTSTDSTVASVDANGKVSAIKKGTATITVTSAADPTKSATCVVTVSCAHANTTVYPATESDCKTPGHAEYTKCNTCGEVISGSDAPLPLSTTHKGGTATCKDKAVCSVCSQPYGDKNANNHAGGTYLVDAKPASCVDGYSGDTYCTGCNTKLAPGIVLPGTGNHVDDNGEWESNATQHFHTCAGCRTPFDHADHFGGTATCKTKKACTACGTTYGELDPNNHTGEGTEVRGAKEPCVYNGYTGDTYCLGCGTQVATGTSITATGSHVDLDGVLNYDASTHFYLCKACGEKFETGDHVYDNDRDRDCNICGATRRIGDVNVQVIGNRANPFTDIALSDPYFSAVEFVYVRGLFKGTSDTLFSPNETMTRAMFVTVLGRLANVSTSAYTKTTFTDVVKGEYYAPYVEWAAEKGIILGYGDGTFGVNDHITVEQMAVIMARYAKTIGIDTKSSETLKAYRDSAEVADWALAEMKWAVENGIYEADGGLLTPKADSKRSLIAEVLYTFVTKFVG